MPIKPGVEMRRKIVTLGLTLILLAPLVAFMPSENMSVKKSIGNYLMKYCIEKKFLSDKLYVEGLKFDHDAGIITLSISPEDTILYVFARVFETFMGVFVAIVVNSDVDRIKNFFKSIN